MEQSKKQCSAVPRRSLTVELQYVTFACTPYTYQQLVPQKLCVCLSPRYLGALQCIHLQRNPRRDPGVNLELLWYGQRRNQSNRSWFGVFHMLLLSASELQTFS